MTVGTSMPRTHSETRKHSLALSLVGWVGFRRGLVAVSVHLLLGRSDFVMCHFDNDEVIIFLFWIHSQFVIRSPNDSLCELPTPTGVHPPARLI